MKLYWWQMNNFGDSLSPMIMAHLLHGEVSFSPIEEADVVGAGSLLFGGGWLRYQVSYRNPIKSLLNYRKMRQRFNRQGPLNVWGTGFICWPNLRLPHLPYRDINALAVRGAITHQLLVRLGMVGSREKIVYGDPGVLYPMLLDEMPTKRFDLGFVPHYADAKIGREIFKRIIDVGINAVYVDVAAKDPLEPLKSIAECRTIVSSSLHGLIVADAMGIPNLRMKLSSFNLGDKNHALKFADYYSAYGMGLPDALGSKDILCSLRKLPDRVMQQYAVPQDCVNSVKEEMRNCFPYETT